MAKRSPSDPAGPSTRRPNTIELAATEVTSDPASTPGASSSASSEASAPGNSSASPRQDGITWLPSGTRWSSIGAGAVGAVGVLLVLALLWSFGLVGGRTTALADRLAAIETQLRELTARPVPAANNSRAIDELITRLTRVEGTAFAPPSPLSDPALANRLASAENATKTFADDIGSLNRRTDDFANAVRDLRNRADTMAASLIELQNALRAIAPAIDKNEIETLTNRIAALERAAGSLESELGKRATIASDRAIRLAFATAALRAAVERGEPFAGELAAARPLALDAALAPLESFAATGVPSNAALARELTALVPALRRAAEAVPAESGFLDRLKSSAQRLVRIRPADEIPGDEPAAIVARIEVKAAHADVAGALADLAKLPPPVRLPAQPWIDKAQARIAAIDMSRQIAADAISALGKASP
jgi:hypothetical protein